jgi:hypothetical protein
MTEVPLKTPAEVAELHVNHPDILTMAKYGYAVIGQCVRKDPETIYQKRWCRGVKLAFYDGLVKLGYDPRSVIRARGLLQTHHYIDLESERGLILVDGTWQQFVPRKKRTGSLPKVAVGTAEEVVDLATNSGVADANLVYWSEGPSSDVQYEQRVRLDQPPSFDEGIDLFTYRAIAE